MGKEWPFGGRSFPRRARDATVDRHRHHRRPSLSGCMSTLFHLFDFHSSPFTHFVYKKHNISSTFHLSHHSPNFLKNSNHGVEAPRNSLELDEASISCLRNKNENLQIQIGLQINTSKSSGKNSKASEQKHQNIALNSPSAKTPNLLARLMGLDILPQTPSPSSPSGRRSCYHVSGTRSLPESPRASSSRLSDVDRHDHRRLSLQISSEEKNIDERDVRKVALVDITNRNKKLEYGKRDDEFSSKEQEVICKKQKAISMSMSRSRPKTKAKAREEDEGSNDLVDNLNNNVSTKFSVKKKASPFVAEVPREQTKQACSSRKGKAVDGGERNAVDSSAATYGGAAELKYIRRILPSDGISTNMLARAKSEVAEDVDSLIDTDLGKWNMSETDGIARVLQFHILDSLLRETTAAIVSVQKRCRLLRDGFSPHVSQPREIISNFLNIV